MVVCLFRNAESVGHDGRQRMRHVSYLPKAK